MNNHRKIAELIALIWDSGICGQAGRELCWKG
jgi:hypothetical protein